MKFYIAARFTLKEEVRKIYDLLKEKGHEITVDWTLHKPIQPYDQNKELAEEYTSEDIQGVKDCDVFVLIGDEAGTGVHTELGVAILSYLKHRKPLIYVIGENNTKSMFYFHPAVEIKKDIYEVLDDLDM